MGMTGAAFVVGLLQRQSDCNKIIKNNKGERG